MKPVIKYNPESTCEDCAREIVRRIWPRSRTRSGSTQFIVAIVSGEIERYTEAKASNAVMDGSDPPNKEP